VHSRQFILTFPIAYIMCYMFLVALTRTLDTHRLLSIVVCQRTAHTPPLFFTYILYKPAPIVLCTHVHRPFVLRRRVVASFSCLPSRRRLVGARASLPHSSPLPPVHVSVFVLLS
jgi:hypothetical protein